MNKDEILLAQKEHLFPSVFHYYKTPLVIEKAKDQYVWDADGNQYLDFFGGIVTISVGHCNDTVNEKVHAQIDKLQHVSTVFATEPQVALAKKIASITPGGQLTKSFFTNSGTEANETAILAARCYTGATEIIALRHSYHGRSSMAMALTAHARMASWTCDPAGNCRTPTMPTVIVAPSVSSTPSAGSSAPRMSMNSSAPRHPDGSPALSPSRFRASAASSHLPKEYFPIVEKIVRNYGGVFISDEVQTGWGRTGGKVVRHRAMGRHSRHHHQRQRYRRTDRPLDSPWPSPKLRTG